MANAVAGARIRTTTRTLGVSRRRASAPSVLWGAEDLLRWVITLGLGGIVIVVCWYIAAGQATFSQQVGPLDAAVAGLLLAGIGNLAWLIHGRRALGERRRLLLPDVAEAVAHSAQPAQTVVAEPVSAAEAALEQVFLAGEGMERYHRPGCALASGRTGWTTATRREHELAGRRRCGVCQP